jgi:hypothetical protein
MYENYINWESIPKEVTHVRFETIVEDKEEGSLLCQGIRVLERPSIKASNKEPCLECGAISPRPHAPYCKIGEAFQ